MTDASRTTVDRVGTDRRACDDGVVAADPPAASRGSEPSVLAIIPAYNEEDTIAAVVEGVAAHVDAVVVVDDASEDRTEAIAREVADGVVVHPRNLGVGAAVDTGYRLAVREGYDLLVQLDGDGQHDPDRVPELLEAKRTSGAAMVVGSRWLNGSHREYSMVRRVGVAFFTAVANVLGDAAVTDVTSGFRVYDVSLLAGLGRPENRHWALEQTLEVARGGHRIAEVSVPMRPDPEGSQFALGTFALYPPRMVLSTLKVLLFR